MGYDRWTYRAETFQDKPFYRWKIHVSYIDNMKLGLDRMVDVPHPSLYEEGPTCEIVEIIGHHTNPPSSSQRKAGT
jgi:hypothetical protein